MSSVSEEQSVQKSNPLNVAALRAALLRPVGGYAAVDVVEHTGSTNVDLAAAARAGAGDRTVLIAEEQTAGQGRRTRPWVSPPGTGLYLSVLLRPTDVPLAKLPWLALVAGIALARTAEWVGVEAALKWPNDLLLGSPRKKAAGVLAEVISEAAPHGTGKSLAVVLGIGLNINHLPPDVPLGAGGLGATSLADEGAIETDRTALAIRLLSEFATAEKAWRDHGGDSATSGLKEQYRRRCETIGKQVRVEVPGGREVTGLAEDLGNDGTLLVRSDDGTERSLSAGDVVHVRAGNAG
ncbi:MAG TPA: biotin--[acetyl-CoA-carboxylase] ligase [Pseudonocardiaceae bacterium]